jgi:hypothetical protein
MSLNILLFLYCDLVYILIVCPLWSLKTHSPFVYEVWKPDVILANYVNRKDIFEETGMNFIIYNNGTVLWHSSTILKTFVHVDTTNYHTSYNGTLIKPSPPYELVFHFKNSSVQEMEMSADDDNCWFLISKLWTVSNENIILAFACSELFKSDHSYTTVKTFVHVDTTNYPFEVQTFHFNFSELYFDDSYEQNYYNSEDNVTDIVLSNGEWVFNDQRGQTMRIYTKSQYRNGKYSET